MAAKERRGRARERNAARYNETRNDGEEPQGDVRRDIGFRGEAAAAQFMRDAGWQVVARNYRLKMGEIDLIVRRDEKMGARMEPTVAIVEVKTRTRSDGPPPEASVNFPKRQRLVRLAQAFLQRENIRNVNVRFDVIAVDTSGEEVRITHFPYAFDEDGEVW